jgi:exopolysaccharide biosynthesis predicted pyruvyltransferase EpsI
MEINIEDYLSALRSEEVIYIPNPGNAGDSVIATATYQLLDRLRIPYKLVRPTRLDSRGKVLIYGGGGNLGTANSFSYRLLSQHHKSAKRLVVLPHSIHNIDDLAAKFGSNVDLICRELVSYEYVKKHAGKANAFLANDMAFSLDVNTVLGKDPEELHTSLPRYLYDRLFTNKNVVSWQLLYRSRQAIEMANQAALGNDKESLTCFRTDSESKGRSLPPMNVDLSEIFQFGVETPESANLATQTLLMFLKRYKTIHTDRLHVGIASALLGLDVHFHANNYYKCRAVYEHSMAGRFTNVKWED